MPRTGCEGGSPLRRGLFVTGTDTGVGKTVASAALMHRLRQDGVRRVSDPSHPGSDTRLTPLARYWKPIQTGIEQDDDTAEVQRLAACSDAEILKRGVRLPRPLSPHLSARLHGVRISLDDVLRFVDAESPDAYWVVEGAGGVLVPINESELMIDLMARLALPVAVVARTALGTINHTLLTIHALRARKIPVAGVLLIGDRNDENRDAIATYGGVRVLGVMPRFEALTSDALASWARTGLDAGGLL